MTVPSKKPLILNSIATPWKDVTGIVWCATCTPYDGIILYKLVNKEWEYVWHVWIPTFAMLGQMLPDTPTFVRETWKPIEPAKVSTKIFDNIKCCPKCNGGVERKQYSIHCMLCEWERYVGVVAPAKERTPLQLPADDTMSQETRALLSLFAGFAVHETKGFFSELGKDIARKYLDSIGEE